MMCSRGRHSAPLLVLLGMLLMALTHWYFTPRSGFATLSEDTNYPKFSVHTLEIPVVPSNTDALDTPAAEPEPVAPAPMPPIASPSGDLNAASEVPKAVPAEAVQYADEYERCAAVGAAKVKESALLAATTHHTVKTTAADILKDDNAVEVQATYEEIIRTGFIDKHFAITHGIYPGFVKAYPEARTILEAGAGACQLVAALECLGKEAYGVELSDHMIKTACHSHVKAGVVKHGSLTDIVFADNQFDLVFSSEVFEHIPEQYHTAAIKELVRVSKGRLFLTISSRRSKHDPKPPLPAVIHVSVMPRKYWIDKFAAVCCYENRGIVKKVHFRKKETYALECIKPCNV